MQATLAALADKLTNMDAKGVAAELKKLRFAEQEALSALMAIQDAEATACQVLVDAQETREHAESWVLRNRPQWWLVHGPTEPLPSTTSSASGVRGSIAACLPEPSSASPLILREAPRVRQREEDDDAAQPTKRRR